MAANDVTLAKRGAAHAIARATSQVDAVKPIAHRDVAAAVDADPIAADDVVVAATTDVNAVAIVTGNQIAFACVITADEATVTIDANA